MTEAAADPGLYRIMFDAFVDGQDPWPTGW